MSQDNIGLKYKIEEQNLILRDFSRDFHTMQLRLEEAHQIIQAKDQEIMALRA